MTEQQTERTPWARESDGKFWKGGKVLEMRLKTITRAEAESPVGTHLVSYLGFESPNRTSVGFHGDIPDECIGHWLEYSVYTPRQVIRDLDTGKTYSAYMPSYPS